MEHIGQLTRTVSKNLIQSGTSAPPDSKHSLSKRPETSLAEPLDETTFGKAMTILLAHFPKMDISHERAVVMYESLKDLRHEELIRGVRAFCLAHEEVYPGTNVIALIRKYALGHKMKKTALEAWQEVMEQIRKTCWPIHAPKFDDPLVKRVVDMIGYGDIANSQKIGVERSMREKINPNRSIFPPRFQPR